MAEMVWCRNCKTVVWAYDQQPAVDLRGICNMLNLPCPKCGSPANFDGWSDKNQDYQHVKETIGTWEPTTKVYDWWSIMRYVARTYKVEWEPSGNNFWFNESFKVQWESCPVCKQNLERR